ncbi:hypothetical protein [Methanobrevibacter sp.]|uniref:hypothetical protein n=1 Tax=Methanobrevibacter sp. TaxID=66852 RepID=UPI0026DEE008|nr:hypothetical protein [Methanobrevibacter sp.]MDO5823772.1 hypothetical protein [Methanobrevibacter sp.]
MSSRSAKVLVIFIVAIVAFCFACVFASMTGPISILPNESDSGSILDNISTINSDDNDNVETYSYQDYKDTSSRQASSSEDSDVETIVDDSGDNADESGEESNSKEPANPNPGNQT